jgi:hypothetical protein
VDTSKIFSDIIPSTDSGLAIQRSQVVLIVGLIMRRRATGGQGANVCNLGRFGSAGSDLAPGSDHFRVLAEAEIKVIGRMAPIPGTLLPHITDSRLAMARVTP